jgi:hypothetical protein
MCTGIGWENLNEIDHWEDISIEGKIILKLILNNVDGRARTGFV